MKDSFDRMVEDPDYYVRIQKTKIVVVVILLAIVLIAKLF